MKAGDVVTLSIRQSDGQRKIRPALLVKRVPPFDDWMVAPLSTQLRHAVPGIDMLIDRPHDDFAATGLRSDSIIRISQLQTVAKQEISGVIGVLPAGTFRHLLQQFSAWLQEE
jgi:mRNA interferase MazF